MSLVQHLLTAADLPRVNGWIAAPHVAPWWDDPLDVDDLCDPHHRLWLAADAAGPFAFVQDYDPHAEPGHLLAACRRVREGSTCSSASRTASAPAPP